MKSRGLHATTWWAIALLAALLATLSSSPLFLAIEVVLSLVAMTIFRDSSLRSRSLGFYIVLAIAVISIRFAFRIVFNQPDALQPTALNLPLITVANTFSFFGPVSFLSLHAALVDGLRLAAILVCLGLANTVANPRKLLRSTPGALYEIATAAAVAINLAPQMVESMHRVRKARTLRSDAKGFKALRTIVIPVLEDALERSLALAASMDSRGFGRQEVVTNSQKISARLTSVAALIFLGVGSFSLLASNSPVVALVLLAVGVALLALTFRLQSRRQLRTFYRPERPGMMDALAFSVTLISLIAVSAL